MRRCAPIARSDQLARGSAAARLRRAALGLARARDGATAVEFAMVALPFFALLFGILELAMLFMVSTSLDNATAVAGRTIRTGQMQTGGSPSAGSFKTAICNGLGWLEGECGSNLHVDVRKYPTFAGIQQLTPISNNTVNTGTFTFDPGCAGDIVVVRTYYQWTLFTPLLSGAVATLDGGKILVSSTLAFRNEPYATTCP